MKGKKQYILEKQKEVNRIYVRKGGAWALTLVLLFTAFITMSVFAPTASAQLQTPSYFGWNGYEGNQTIYLTTVDKVFPCLIFPGMKGTKPFILLPVYLVLTLILFLATQQVA